MIRVLFVCVHNSARSQMAEAYLRKLGGSNFEVDSGGLEPGSINPYVAEVMREDGIDISLNKTNSVFDYFKEERRYDVVITVCSPEVSEQCPVFPGKSLRLNWPFPDPSRLEGEKEQVLIHTRIIRDQIKEKVTWFIDEYEQQGLKIFINQPSA